jgi:hypothetical protein
MGMFRQPFKAWMQILASLQSLPLHFLFAVAAEKWHNFREKQSRFLRKELPAR